MKYFNKTLEYLIKTIFAMLFILGLLLLCQCTAKEVIKASDRYNQGQQDMITAHKIDNYLNRVKE